MEKIKLNDNDILIAKIQKKIRKDGFTYSEVVEDAGHILLFQILNLALITLIQEHPYMIFQM